ncbi:hypothetical protein CSC2_22690 [Clostridium zeae]|uniref:Uncharacterized protein n=1 Tax=Clostridium zeae TaxID=2759022 RepID=A0ABQ1EB56_9CLOT|nr:hypothetical protein [Clostridium zeae]GFZ31743.1 hypothetical protein CSC2_22690 [Clostridium zeae]
MKLKKMFIKGLTLLLSLSLVLPTIPAYASTNKNITSTETLTKFEEIAHPSKDITILKSTYSTGRVDYTTLNKATGEIMLSDSNPLMSKTSNSTKTYKVSDIMSKPSNSQNTLKTKNADGTFTTLDSGYWVYKWSCARTNAKYEGMVAGVVIGAVMAVTGLGALIAGSAVGSMWATIASGAGLPTALPAAFPALGSLWEYDSNVYYDAHNSSNGMTCFHYWFAGSYKGSYTGYFTWS